MADERLCSPLRAGAVLVPRRPHAVGVRLRGGVRTRAAIACILYAPGTALYLMTRRENRQRMFRPYEAVVCVLFMLAALVGVAGIATGRLTI